MIEKLGETQLPYSVFLDYLLTIGENKFKAGSWDLVKLNSNSFSDELSQFICGQGLPKYILELPPDMRTTPEICTQMGRISAPQFSGISLGLIRESRTGRARREESPEFEQLQAQIDALMRPFLPKMHSCGLFLPKMHSGNFLVAKNALR